AAKEAILKAIGTGWARGIAWTDLEVRNSFSGEPRVLVCGGAKEVTLRRGIGDILVSISHCRTYATAYALALGPGASRGKDGDGRVDGPDDGGAAPGERGRPPPPGPALTSLRPAGRPRLPDGGGDLVRVRVDEGLVVDPDRRQHALAAVEAGDVVV